MKIGFDLDGVILDNTSYKVQKFKQIYGMDLNNWQVSSNVIDEYVPNKDIRRHVGSLAGTRSIATFVDKKSINLFKKLKNKNCELFIISRRGKSEEGQKAAIESIEKLGIKDLFNEIILCENEDIKNKVIIENKIQIFIDDRIDVIERLQNEIDMPLLFDNFNLIKQGKVKNDHNLRFVNSFSELEEVIDDYEKNRLL